MSRFYDALKEATRSQAMPNAKPEGDKPDDPVAAGNTFGIEMPAVQVPEAMNEPPLREIPDAKPDLVPLELLEEAPAKANGSEPLPSAPQDLLTELMSDVVPKVKAQIRFSPNARLIPQAANPAVVEHYRRLRTKILQQHASKPFKSLLVTSPGPEEGKTVTALNLALSFAMLPDFKVLIVDGDLRRGTIGKLLGVENHPGLSDMMAGTASLNDVVLQCLDLPIHFVLRGNAVLPPAELLHSTDHLSRVFRHMTQEFDLVVVDSPPVNLITDAQLLSENCDAVLIVARAFRTSRKGLEQAVRDLQDSRIIGTVLNGGTRVQLYRGYHGYYG